MIEIEESKSFKITERKLNVSDNEDEDMDINIT